jgi:hypothetical protein
LPDLWVQGGMLAVIARCLCRAWVWMKQLLVSVLFLWFRGLRCDGFEHLTRIL